MLQRWHLDLIGPYTTSTSGNKYGIVAIDSVSKWPEAGAIPSKTADNVKKWVWDNIITRYGTPQEIVTDNGSEFKGEFAALLSRCDITHHLTSPHHPQANGLVERLNQTIKNSIKSGVSGNLKVWDQQIPLALLGLRASKQATTKMSPCQVLYGHQIRLPIVAEAAIFNEEQDLEASEATITTPQTDRPNHMATIQELALRNIERAADCVRRSSVRAAAKRKSTSLPAIGDMILIRNFDSNSLAGYWEQNVYRCAGYNNSHSVMTVEDSLGTKWTENVSNTKLYQQPEK